MMNTFTIFVFSLYLLEQVTSVPVSSAAISNAVTESIPNKLLSRGRSIVPNSRRRGETVTEIGSKITERPSAKRTSSHSISRLFSNFGLENDNLTQSRAKEAPSRRRHRRWDYDENYDWENGGKDYVVPGEEPRKETKFEKLARSWQKHALKVMFLFSFVCMLCCCCLAICKKSCDKICETILWHLRDYRDLCLNRDPSYRKARKFADDYGIELDYDQYTQLKQRYEEGFRRGGHREYQNLSGR